MNAVVLDGRYELGEVIGEGSFNIVYRARDRVEDRLVAVKQLRSEGIPKDEQEEARDLFFREIEFLRKLDHVSVPQYYYFLVQDDKYYLVMELIEGDDLLGIMKKKGILSSGDALSYMSRVADALVYLQEQDEPVIFKDLKPANIVIDTCGRLRLIDFGTARRFSLSKSRDTYQLGTPGYAPPEAYSQTEQTDPSSDVYSFGATFFHLLTGKDPAIFRFNFPSPQQFNLKASDSLSALILDCLKPRETRIQDARILKSRIEQVSETDKVAKPQAEFLKLDEVGNKLIKFSVPAHNKDICLK